MRVFRSKWFVKFALKEHISDATLCEAVNDAEIGNMDAEYGGGAINQRIARPNKGKSGGTGRLSFSDGVTEHFSSMRFRRADDITKVSLRNGPSRTLQKEPLRSPMQRLSS